MSRGTVGLVGAGAAGPPIVMALARAGWKIGVVASRRSAAAEAACLYLGGGTAANDAAEAAKRADLLILAVPDRAIGDVAADIASRASLRSDVLAVHLAGALSSKVLLPLARAGASTGSIHPLISFADRDSAIRQLSDAFVFYEGDEPERMRSLALELSPRAVPLAREAKVLYHAGAAAACNLATAMVDLGVRLLEEAGIERETALAALLPLVRGTVENLGEVGLPAALTGPIERGDVSTVRAHVEKIRELAPDLLPAYATASLLVLEIAKQKGTLSAETATELEALLRAP